MTDSGRAKKLRKALIRESLCNCSANGDPDKAVHDPFCPVWDHTQTGADK